MALSSKNLIFVLLVLLLCCKHKNDDVFPGTQKGCKVETSIFYTNGVITSREISEYDAQFNLVKKLYFGGGSNSAFEYNYEYERNEKGQITKELVKNEGDFLSSIDFVYHPNGQLQSKQEKDKYNTHLEEFDDRGNQVRDFTRSYDNSVFEVTKTFNEKSKILKIRDTAIVKGIQNRNIITNYTYKDDLLDRKDYISAFPDNGRVTTTTYEYNNSRSLILESTVYAPGHSLFVKYEYNANGMLFMETRFGEDDPIGNFTKFEYNENGLLIRKVKGNSAEPSWITEEFSHFPSGQLKHSISYYYNGNLPSNIKRPMNESILDEKGNVLQSSFYDISGQKQASSVRTYVCRN